MPHPVQAVGLGRRGSPQKRAGRLLGSVTVVSTLRGFLASTSRREAPKPERLNRLPFLTRVSSLRASEALGCQRKTPHDFIKIECLLYPVQNIEDADFTQNLQSYQVIQK